MMTKYVCGFLFSGDPINPQVLLIRKERPLWQKGRLNGIGGKIESGENAIEAMCREFKEEACLDVHDWTEVANLLGDGFDISFFSAWASSRVFGSARSGTDEQIERHVALDIMRLDVLPNLRVLVPLALDNSGITKPVRLFDHSRK